VSGFTVFSLIPILWGKVFEVTNSRPIVVEATGGGFQSHNSKRLRPQAYRFRKQSARSAYQMYSCLSATYRSHKRGPIFRAFIDKRLAAQFLMVFEIIKAGLGSPALAYASCLQDANLPIPSFRDTYACHD
jgi:hypothetical protein